MDRESARPESLPPLELRSLRDLDLREPARPGQHAHLAEASGVARRGDYVYVVSDQELHLGVFELSTGRPGWLEQVLEGELPADQDERAGRKPDLEALTTLPPWEGHPHGTLLGIGSGSGPGRDRGFAWALGADGSLRGSPAEITLEPVYELLRQHVSDLNIEGISAMGDRLWLLQRGNTPEARNIIVELSLAKVMESLHTDLRIDAHELLAVRTYDLGNLDDVELCFSDATPVGDQMLVFTASAEGQPGDLEADAIHGSVVGTIDDAGRIRRMRTIDRSYKVEGVYAIIDAGVFDLLFVCDQDDPDHASPLLSATMPAEARVEVSPLQG